MPFILKSSKPFTRKLKMFKADLAGLLAYSVAYCLPVL